MRLLKGAKPAISIPGLKGESESKPAILTPGLEGAGESKPAISTAGKSVGRKSQCEPLAEVIMAKVEVGLSAQRIYQDLVEENGFTVSYKSVKRFVRELRAARPERIWRLERQPGEEVQLDFGFGAPIDARQGKNLAQFGAAHGTELFA